MKHTIEEKKDSFGHLLDVMDELRAKCPWDSKQTITSLRTLTIEEVYELADAISKNDLVELKKELGDVLMHVVFYALIADETSAFDIKEVCDSVCEKLIFRHPHIFGDVKADTSEQVAQNWEQLKLKENGGNRGVLRGVPDALPALIKAYRIQDKARHAGFDWEERTQVWTKVKEEIAEFEQELACCDKEKQEAEFGDLFFALVNAARLYDINPENALERTNKKFISRFNDMESSIKAKGLNIKDLSLKEMDHYWELAKQKGL